MNPLRKIVVGGTLVAATLTGGAIGASFFGTTNAATTPDPSTSSAPANPPASTDAQAPAFPAHGSADHEGAEKAVTGDNASKAQAAAVKSVGSGTAGAVTSDFNGGGYEVTVTKADGSQVEVHLTNTFTVMQGPGGGHHRGGNDGDADDQAGANQAGSTSTTQG